MFRVYDDSTFYPSNFVSDFNRQLQSEVSCSLACKKSYEKYGTGLGGKEKLEFGPATLSVDVKRHQL
jgi:hypothetical protein